MARPYHSTSSVNLGQRCMHAAALRYIAGIREPRVTWEEIADDPTHEQRATALGGACHKVLEDYATPGKIPDWHGFPGQVVEAGRHLIPNPRACEVVIPEGSIGDVSLVVHYHPESGAYWARREFDPGDGLVEDVTGCANHEAAARADGVPTHALEVHGVLWAGFRDLLVYGPEELARLEIDAPDGWVLADYKTSANIARYAHTPASLLDDLQANLYAVDVCRMLALPRIPARWIYFESKKVRRAKAVDVTIELDRALEVVEPACTFAKEFDLLERVEDAPKNPLACFDYGRTCFYHKSRGGPCDARRSIGALIQARVPKKDTTKMPMTKEQEERMASIKKKFAPKQAEPETEQGEGDEQGDGAEETKPEKPAKPKFGGVKPSAKKPGAKTKPAAAGEGSSLRELVEQLEAAEALCAELKAQIVAMVAA